MKKPVLIILIVISVLVACDKNQNDEQTQFSEAQKLLVQQKDCKKAVLLIENMVSEDKLSGLTLKGLMYEYGLCTKIDTKKAEIFYKKAIDKGYIPAYNALASVYLSENYKKESGFYNTKDAITLLNQAIDKKESGSAMYLLGVIYYYDIYNHKDIQKAKYWLQKAKDKGDKDAQNLLNKID